MTSDSPIKRKVTIVFLDGSQESYTNEEYSFSFETQAVFINDKYTTEMKYILPYNNIKKVHQESIR